CNKSIDKFHIKKSKSSDKNEDWEQFISENLGDQYLAKLKKKKVHLNNPNALGLFYLYRWLLEDGKIQSSLSSERVKMIYNGIDVLRLKRNDIAHSMGTMTATEIGVILDNWESNIEELYAFLDEITHSNKFGIFETI